jgi:hypothetical protein
MPGATSVAVTVNESVLPRVGWTSVSTPERPGTPSLPTR